MLERFYMFVSCRAVLIPSCNYLKCGVHYKVTFCNFVLI